MVMRRSALQRKLLRELTKLRGQLASIALVLAAGLACFVALRGTFDSLAAARDAYYEAQRFAHLLVRLERAPESLRERLAKIPGVRAIDTRIGQPVRVPIEGMPLPAYGHLLSLPADGSPSSNAPWLREGELPRRGHEASAPRACARSSCARATISASVTAP